ncbi:MAG: hypothetical protein WAZ18_02085 [Alphaproteobacteria bacterium]
MVDASKELAYLVENGFGDAVVVSPSNEKMSLRDYVRGTKWSSGREHRPILCSVECAIGTRPVLLWAQETYQHLISNVSLGDKSGQGFEGVAMEVLNAFTNARLAGSALDEVQVNYNGRNLCFTSQDSPYKISTTLQKVTTPNHGR